MSQHCCTCHACNCSSTSGIGVTYFYSPSYLACMESLPLGTCIYIHTHVHVICIRIITCIMYTVCLLVIID